MTLPGYDTMESYTKDELDHVVAREVMKHRLDDLKSKLDDQSKMMNSSIINIENQLSEIYKLIKEQSTEVEKCRKELKEEIKHEYATRIELQELRADLRVLSTKIITAVSIIVTIIQFGFQYFGK